MKLHKSWKKLTACFLACVVFITMSFGITSEAAYGTSHDGRFANCRVYNGIDVSSWNKEINWVQVKASGIDFAFIKLAGRGYGDSGNKYIDSKGIQNCREAKAAGIKIGVYMFSQATNEAEAADEAQYILNIMRKNNISVDLPVVMDYEFSNHSDGAPGRLTKANLTKEAATNVCMTFCNVIASSGYTPMVYADKNMLTNHLNANAIANRYPVWLAQYRSSATYTGAYSYWQYSSIGTVPGIVGNVDMNYYYSQDGTLGAPKMNIPAPTPETAPEEAELAYATHVQSKGWEYQESYDGKESGTVGSSKRLEAIKIRINRNNDKMKDIQGSVEYQVHCQTFGWLDWVMDGEQAGFTGMSKRLEAIRIKLTGELAEKYDIYYKVHIQSYGWLDWAKNGETAGSTGLGKRLEAIEIKLVEKNGAAPGATENSYKSPLVAYETHVQTYGWQGTVIDGATSGTTGRAKRLEAIRIKNTSGVQGDITYRVHGQTYGWTQGWKKNGEMAGTVGCAKRLEAIQIQLTGQLAEKYDVYYRVHAQTYGWLDWAKNGEPAGTAGKAKRLEAIQIVLVPKGGVAPGNTARPYIGPTVNN